MQTVQCVSTHPEDLADGRTVEPGAQVRLVDTDEPHNARLIDEQRLLVLPDTGSEAKQPTIDQVLGEVGDDPEKAQAALDIEQARDKPRNTLVARLQAIVEPDPNPDEEASE